MLNDWKTHCYQGPCEFTRTDDGFAIQTDTADARGSWYAYADAQLLPGDELVVYAYITGPGTLHAVYFCEGEYFYSQRIEPGKPFIPDPDADQVRIDLRLWRNQGIATFSNVTLTLQQQGEEPEPVEGLPVPPVAEMQKHRVSGYKWGRTIFLWDLDSEEITIPPQAYPWEVVGHQVGRTITLEVRWPYDVVANAEAE